MGAQDGRARCALAQAQKEAKRAAHSKVGLAEDLYVSLQRNHRKLNRCRIRASEVHVKTSRRVKPSATSEDPNWHPPKRDSFCSPPPSPRQKHRRGDYSFEDDSFALPNYIVEMNRELQEDDIDSPEADGKTTPLHRPVALTDLVPGLGDAVVAAHASTMSSFWPLFEDSVGFGSLNAGASTFAELSIVSASATATGRDLRTVPRAATAQPAARGDKQLPPLAPLGSSGNPVKGADKAVPTRPVMETMPQHLASDTYWVHRPIYVSAQQIRWEKRDGAQTIIAMRRELAQKVCLDGLPRSLVKTAGAMPSQQQGQISTAMELKRPVGPAEAKIRAKEPIPRTVTR